MMTDKPIPTVDNERPKPATVEAVKEAAAECTLDPKATPRSNQARLLFSLYYCIGLPFPWGWREACCAELASRGIPADTLALDVLHSAMLTEEVEEFDGWPGIDRRLVRDLIDRQRPLPRRLPVKRQSAPPTIKPRITNEFDADEVERVVAAVGEGRTTSAAVARAMVSFGFTGRQNLPLARAVCQRLEIQVADGTIAGMLTPSVLLRTAQSVN